MGVTMFPIVGSIKSRAMLSILQKVDKCFQGSAAAFSQDVYRYFNSVRETIVFIVSFEFKEMRVIGYFAGFRQTRYLGC